MRTFMKKLAAASASAALAAATTLAGCSAPAPEPEQATPAASISIAAEGWSAETDTQAMLQITSEVGEEGEEPEVTEFVVLAPNMDEAASVELAAGSYNVAVVYPMKKEGGEAYVPASPEPITLTISEDSEDEAPGLSLVLDEKRLLTKDELEERIAILDEGDFSKLADSEQAIAEIKDAYTKALASAEKTANEGSAQDGTAASDGDAAAAGSSADAPSASTGTPGAPAAEAASTHVHNWQPVYFDQYAYVCCDGASFTWMADASAHEMELERADNTNHSNAHISCQLTGQYLNHYACSCGATTGHTRPSL